MTIIHLCHFGVGLGLCASFPKIYINNYKQRTLRTAHRIPMFDNPIYEQSVNFGV